MIATEARAVFAEHKSEIPDLEDLDLARTSSPVQGVGVWDFGEWFTEQRAAGKGLFGSWWRSRPLTLGPGSLP